VASEAALEPSAKPCRVGLLPGRIPGGDVAVGWGGNNRVKSLHAEITDIALTTRMRV